MSFSFINGFCPKVNPISFKNQINQGITSISSCSGIADTYGIDVKKEVVAIGKQLLADLNLVDDVSFGNWSPKPHACVQKLIQFGSEQDAMVEKECLKILWIEENVLKKISKNVGNNSGTIKYEYNKY